MSALRHIPRQDDIPDGLVAYLHHETVAPEGRTAIRRSWEKEITESWERGRPGPGAECLRPLVYVTPLEITTDLFIGEDVQVDVGESSLGLVPRSRPLG